MLAVRNEVVTGRGWAEFAGDSWPWPEARSGTLKILDSMDEERQLVIDSVTGEIREIMVRDLFLDRDGDYTGDEIACEIRLKEHRGSAEHFFLEHLESHIYLRPYNEDVKDDANHDAYGYRNAFEVDLALLKDGEQVDEAQKTVNVPLDGDIVFDRLVTPAHRWQPKINTTTSAFRIVRTNNYYKRIDKIAIPDKRAKTEQLYQEEFNSPLMFLGRDEINPLLDRVGGTTLTGSYTGLTTGPDEKANTALNMISIANGIVTPALSVSADFTMNLFISGQNQVTTNMLSSGMWRFQLIEGTPYEIRFTDGVVTVSATIDYAGSGWAMFTAVRQGQKLSLYENGVLKTMYNLPTLESIATAWNIMDTMIGNIFDVRIYDKRITGDALAYFYQDVIKNNGNCVCPFY